jgi:Transcriptional regulator, AbiEi antitoxin
MPRNPGESDDSPLADRFYALASPHGGLLTAREATEAGIPRSTLEYHAAHSGQLERCSRGVYRLRRFPRTPLTPVWQAYLPLSAVHAVLSHGTALWILRLQSERPARVDLSLPRSERWRTPAAGTRLHFPSRPLHGRALLLGGLPVAPAADAILAALHRDGLDAKLEHATFAAIRRRLASPRQLRTDWPSAESSTLHRIVRAATSLHPSSAPVDRSR